MVAPPTAAVGPRLRPQWSWCVGSVDAGRGPCGRGVWDLPGPGMHPLPCTGRQALNPRPTVQPPVRAAHASVADGEPESTGDRWAMQRHWKLQTWPEGVTSHWGCRVTMEGPGPLSKAPPCSHDHTEICWQDRKWPGNQQKEGLNPRSPASKERVSASLSPSKHLLKSSNAMTHLQSSSFCISNSL